MQLLRGGGEQDGGEVESQAMHEGLSFRIAHADVVFEEARAVGGHHEAGVEEAGEVGSRHGRGDDRSRTRCCLGARSECANRSRHPCLRCWDPGRRRRAAL